MYFIKGSNFVEKRIGNELVIVPLVGAVAQMDKVFSVNEVGAFIFSFMSEPVLKETILIKILEEFEINEQQAILDLNSFIDKALVVGVVKIVN